jgi:hypothetical protein
VLGLRSNNNLGAKGVTMLAQVLHHLPQLQTLDLRCALATALPARGACASRSQRGVISVDCPINRNNNLSAEGIQALQLLPHPSTAASVYWL